MDQHNTRYYLGQGGEKQNQTVNGSDARCRNARQTPSVYSSGKKKGKLCLLIEEKEF